MVYVIQLLAAILIGTAIGAALSPRNNILLFGSLIAIALGVVTLITGSWVSLAIGTVVALASQGMQRDNYKAA
ncbi:hypothetical protein [Pusillimonas sp. ANT_WB101]|uniref:hypothetical protein n=1 Tax=Pusillimonas sp. ANT_WB101 TaxID=2597356 RepID=UPI0011EF7941|nr:hypothetical protein [Pusillimonas sp. ANT_WB101]KAA0892911.1 hypothetical protein FQ179_11630 [Pusillimonas sp. ANT_WB101]